MDKAELRRAIRANRAAGHDPSERALETVMARIPAGATVCGYVALPGEPPTTDLLERLLQAGHRVYLPVAQPQGRLDWVAAESSRPWDAWGLPGRPVCPAATVALPPIDVVLVPALAVTADGQRLGQGGGYYDRFLATAPAVRTIALVWSDEVLADVGAQPHDVPVDDWVALDE